MNTLGWVEEGYSGQILAHILRGALIHLIFEDTLLDPVVKALISKVDAELVKQVGVDGRLGMFWEPGRSNRLMKLV